MGYTNFIYREKVFFLQSINHSVYRVDTGYSTWLCTSNESKSFIQSKRRTVMIDRKIHAMRRIRCNSSGAPFHVAPCILHLAHVMYVYMYLCVYVSVCVGLM